MFITYYFFLYLIQNIFFRENFKTQRQRLHYVSNSKLSSTNYISSYRLTHTRVINNFHLKCNYLHNLGPGPQPELHPRSLHSSVTLLKEDTRSEKTAKAIKEVTVDKTKSETTPKPASTSSSAVAKEEVKPKGYLAGMMLKVRVLNAEMKQVGYFKYVWDATKHLVRHYFDGFRLILKNTRYCFPLLWKLLTQGRSSLKRREYTFVSSCKLCISLFSSLYPKL